MFNDDIKRISLTVIDVFPMLNGMQLVTEEVEAVCVIKDVATGEMIEASLADWIYDNSNENDADRVQQFFRNVLPARFSRAFEV